MTDTYAVFTDSGRRAAYGLSLEDAKVEAKRYVNAKIVKERVVHVPTESTVERYKRESRERRQSMGSAFDTASY